MLSNLHHDSYRYVCNAEASARWPVPSLAASSESAICLFSIAFLLLNSFFVLKTAAAALAASLQRALDRMSEILLLPSCPEGFVELDQGK